MASADPYTVLGVARGASDADVRAAYRRMVQLTHPDHNGGSAESAQRFEQVQAAYAELQQKRTRAPGSARATRSAGPRPDPAADDRLAAMEREVIAAAQARQRAARQAQREAAQAAQRAVRDAQRATGAADGRSDKQRASDDELGYVTTDDSFGAIFDDFASGLSSRVAEAAAEAAKEPAGERLADLLDGWGARLRGEKPDRD